MENVNNNNSSIKMMRVVGDGTKGLMDLIKYLDNYFDHDYVVVELGSY